MVLKLLDQASLTQTDHMQHENSPKFQEEKSKMEKFNTKHTHTHTHTHTQKY